jgi:hypothetical protein
MLERNKEKKKVTPNPGTWCQVESLPEGIKASDLLRSAPHALSA